VEFWSVVDEFDELTSKFDFKRARKLWYPHLVAMSKHLEGIFYCYVIARVHCHDGALEATLWVGPVDRPDDGLDNLSANIKVQIGYSQTLDESFFKNCERKIIQLIEAGTLRSLVSTSQKELAEPSVRNRRYEVYTRYMLPFFDRVVAQAGNDKRTLSSKKHCRPIVENVFAGLDGDIKAFFDKLGIKATTDKVWELCYVHSL
jgi:hypothetical protein